MNKATTRQSLFFRLASRPAGKGEGRSGKISFLSCRFIHWSRRIIDSTNYSSMKTANPMAVLYRVVQSSTQMECIYQLS